jgi:hypothetical protein
MHLSCHFRFSNPHFSQPFSDTYEGEEDFQGPLYQPLTGWQYVKNYYPEEDPITQAHIHLPKSLDTKPLINIATLAGKFPSLNLSPQPLADLGLRRNVAMGKMGAV